jgi:hypothetical protein
MRLIPIVACLLAVSLAGCGDDTKTGAPATTATAAPVAAPAPYVPRERVYVTTLEAFPDWVPLPEEYVVIIAGAAGGVGSTVIETSGDPRVVVERLNAQLTAMGLNTISEVEEDEHSRYTAQGVIHNGGKFALIQVGEYDAGGAMKPGNTCSISYVIGG